MAHTAQADWNPVDAPSLWAEVLAGQDGTEIGEWVQPTGAHAPITPAIKSATTESIMFARLTQMFMHQTYMAGWKYKQPPTGDSWRKM